MKSAWVLFEDFIINRAYIGSEIRLGNKITIEELLFKMDELQRDCFTDKDKDNACSVLSNIYNNISKADINGYPTCVKDAWVCGKLLNRSNKRL